MTPSEEESEAVEVEARAFEALAAAEEEGMINLAVMVMLDAVACGRVRGWGRVDGVGRRENVVHSEGVRIGIVCER